MWLHFADCAEEHAGHADRGVEIYCGVSIITPHPYTKHLWNSMRGLHSQGHTRIIQILPTSVRLPPGIQVKHAGFIEVELARISTKTLQMVQIQVHEGLREHELSTYVQNEKLMKDNAQLKQKYKTLSAQPAEKEA